MCIYIYIYLYIYILIHNHIYIYIYMYILNVSREIGRKRRSAGELGPPEPRWPQSRGAEAYSIFVYYIISLWFNVISL